MTSRQYSSFLLRFWLENNSDATQENANPTITLQLQHLQSGVTWRLSSLDELTALLNNALANVAATDLPVDGATTVQILSDTGSELE